MLDTRKSAELLARTAVHRMRGSLPHATAGRLAPAAWLAVALISALLCNPLVDLIGSAGRAMIGRESFSAVDWLRRGHTGWLIAPVGMAALSALVFLLDWCGLGWRKSALRRLVAAPTGSAKADAFYMLLSLSGLLPAATFVASFGGSYLLGEAIRGVYAVKLLALLPGPIAQAAALFVAMSFIGYWAHRLMHMPVLWEFHKVHHAAEEMNVVTSQRIHPLEVAVNGACFALASTLLGADDSIMLANLALLGLWQRLTHSDLQWPLERLQLGWLGRTLVVTPAVHRLHHARLPEQHDRNFSTSLLWDRLFGTWSPPESSAVAIGLEDGKRLNGAHPALEMFAAYHRAAVELLRLVSTRRPEPQRQP